MIRECEPNEIKCMEKRIGEWNLKGRRKRDRPRSHGGVRWMSRCRIDVWSMDSGRRKELKGIK